MADEEKKVVADKATGGAAVKSVKKKTVKKKAVKKSVKKSVKKKSVKKATKKTVKKTSAAASKTSAANGNGQYCKSACTAEERQPWSAFYFVYCITIYCRYLGNCFLYVRPGNCTRCRG